MIVVATERTTGAGKGSRGIMRGADHATAATNNVKTDSPNVVVVVSPVTSAVRRATWLEIAHLTET
jgi:hypothetical protein